MTNPPRLVIPRSRIWSSNGGMTMLLVLLVLFVFVVPILAHFERIGAFIVDVFLTLTVLTGISATSGRRAKVVFTTLALVAVGVRWIPWALPALEAPLLRESSSLATFVLLAGIVAAKVFESGAVTMNRVMGAVVLYLLLGLCWALVYDLVIGADATAFNGVTSERGRLDRWVYYSFVTLTTVGFGDITPVSPVARSLTILEALVGQLYPAILLGRLVSLQTQNSTETR